MRKKIITAVCLILFVFQTNLQAQPFRTQTFSDRAQTLLVHSSGGWEAAPVIEMNKANQIEIQFDMLGAAPEYYTYTITHCDADWKQSSLVTSEYLNGLQNNYIEDYENSFNTRMDYVNYALSIPNDKVQLTVSGNYVLQVWDEYENLILNACFSVVDPQANIRMQVSSMTDKGVNTQYQAVNFEIEYAKDLRIPIQDLKVYVQQNKRLDNEAVLVKPLNIQNRKAFYDHNPALIFEAGNEYRVFEMTTVLYNGLNIETVEYHAPYYHTILKPDIPRNNRSYSYYEDINGRIYIRNINTNNPDTEADYEFVHFYVPCTQPLTENIYILSDAFHNVLDETSQMEYSPVDKGYVKTVLLKEGYYNYLYVTKKNNAYRASTASIEGNYFETENEYRVMVYYRSLGGRYDQLIGIQTLKYR
jgi:hypothetical protein